MVKGKASQKPEKAPGEMELLDQETIEKVVGGGSGCNVKPEDGPESTGNRFRDSKKEPGSLGK